MIGYPLAQLHDGDREIVARRLDGGHVVFYVQESGQYQGYVGLAAGADARAIEFAKAILGVLEPAALGAPTPTVPTERGVYRDKDGDLWLVLEDGGKPTFADGSGIDDPENYLPFTTIFEAKDNA